MTKDQINKSVILILVLGLPLISTQLILDPGLIPRFITLSAINLILSVVLIRKWMNNREAKPLTMNILIISGIFVLYSLFRVSANYVLADSIFEWLKIVMFYLLLVLTYQLFDFKRLKNSLIISLALLGFFLTIWGLAQLAWLIQTGPISIPNSTYNIMACFEHRNIFAQVLLLTVPFQFIQTFRLKSRLLRHIQFIATILTLFLLIVLFNRAVWVAAGFMFCIPVFIFLFLKIRTKNTIDSSLFTYFIRIMGSLVIAILLALGFTNLYTNQEEIELHTTEIISPVKGTAKDRFELWDRTIEMFKEAPVIGKGLSNWKVEVLKYGHEGLVSEDNITFYQRPHNDYLWILSEMGIIGLAIYLSFVLLVFLKIIDLIIIRNRTGRSLFMVAVLMAFSSYLIFSFFSFPRERIVHNIIITLMISAILAFDFEIRDGSNILLKKSFVLLISTDLIIVSAFMIVFGMGRFSGEFHTKKALQAKNEQNYEMIIDHINYAKNPAYKMDPISTPLDWYSGFAYFKLGNPQIAKKQFISALQLNPYHIHVLNNLASAYALQRENDSALVYYEKAVYIAPNFDESWFNMSAIYYNQSNYVQAYETLKKVNFFTQDKRYKPFIKTIIKSLILEEIDKNDSISNIDLPDDEEWYFNVHIQLRNHGRSLENIIFDKDFLTPNK